MKILVGKQSKESLEIKGKILSLEIRKVRMESFPVYTGSIERIANEVIKPGHGYFLYLSLTRAQQV